MKMSDEFFNGPSGDHFSTWYVFFYKYDSVRSRVARGWGGGGVYGDKRRIK
jgi:hypothetical protein